jgi:hypothetical protein
MTNDKASKLIAFLVIAPFLVSAGRTAIACSISDIKIKQADLVHNGHSSTVVGELINGCGEATGVQLHITLRDSAGEVISTDDPWPAGTHNIPPHSGYAFTVNAEERRPAVSLHVDVTEVRQW